MTTWAQYREILAAAIDGKNNLHAYPYWPQGGVQIPAAIVAPFSRNEPEVMGEQSTYTFDILLLTGPVNQGIEKAEKLLDQYLQEGAAYSLLDALYADYDLKSASSYLNVDWKDYGQIEAGGVLYVGARIEVTVERPPECPAGMTRCGDICVNLQTSVTNCGACQNVCTGTTPACCSGVCVDLYFDNNNCGACGNVCSVDDGYTCDQGVCLLHS
jgi:hypothetical protein